MLTTIFWFAVGAVVGWVFPQPEWAKPVVDKVKSWIGK
jgi:hypothetical protein